MPRVRAAPGKQAAASSSYASPMKSVQIPLNDDREEKAQRLHSRQIAHSKQMEQFRAAASPTRKRKSLGGGAGGEDQDTPSQDEDMYGVAGNAVSPVKKNVPILANFEEWMKMATDNKINATNSWNFALIDYFHDMSLLREGDGVNFQKASCTLDGCVKIYTSRVDSVATETGKLLSGLAESKSSKRKGGNADEEGEEGDEDEEGEDGTKKKSRKKAQRSAEATLVNSFEQLRLKKMDLEFSVDPLFKKAAADFDEGGAKGLLMNHLSIDNTGRIVFDSSDDAQQPEAEEARRDSMEPEGADEQQQSTEKRTVEPAVEDGPIDIASLASRFFPDLDKLDTQDICPTLKTFELGSGDASLDLPFLKAPDNWRDEHPEGQDEEAAEEGGSGEAHDNDNVFGMDDGEYDAPGGFDLPPETGFGEGGEAWARDAALQPQMRVHDVIPGGDGDENGEVGTFDTNSNAYGVTLQHRDHEQENILNYFDAALQKNWAGPEHWKIAKIKEASKPAQPQRVRKEKEPFEIDFTAPMTQELATALYTRASSNSAISLPKAQRRSKTRNLLPDDKHFNSKDLLKLFLKPKAKLGARKTSSRSAQQQGIADGGEVDEAYWANNAQHALLPDGDAGVQGDYDANFFQDDNLPLPGGAGDEDDDDVFADAQEDFSPAADGVDDAAAAGPVGAGIDDIVAGGAPGSSQEGADGGFGANLVAQSRRLRPEYVQYARVAKKVDVRRLKEEMWRGIGFDEAALQTPAQPTPATPAKAAPKLPTDDTGALRFTDIMNNLQHAYPAKQMADISTSYGFICLLHLANEKGLVIQSQTGWEELVVRKDHDAVVLEGGGD